MTVEQTFQLATVEDTLALGKSLATKIRTGLIFLYGDLGAGKTTLVRGWLRALGYVGPVASPTYTLIEPYELQGIDILHIDLYRLAKPSEIEYIGLLEQMELSHLQLIEWPEQGGNLLPAPDLAIHLQAVEEARAATVRYFNGELQQFSQ